MAISIQNYSSSDFLTATAMYRMDDGTEVHLWDDESLSIRQIDAETGQEHVVLLRDTIPCSGFIADMMLRSDVIRLS